jgi:hypothetical protein
MNLVLETVRGLGGVRATAAQLGVSKSHVARWCAAGSVFSLDHGLRLADASLGTAASPAERLALLRALAGQKHEGRGPLGATPSTLDCPATTPEHPAMLPQVLG